MSDEASQAIWRFEPLRSFRSPSASLSEATRTGLRGLVARFRDRSDLPAAYPEEALARFGPAELARWIPALPLEKLAEALAEALAPWPETAGPVPIRLVVDPDPATAAVVVRALARARAWTLIEPPSLGSLMHADSANPSWPERLPAVDAPLVVAGLERWFLRHPRCLGPMRDLLGALGLRHGPTLVSCGSWAHTWLRGALDTDTTLPEPWTLAALDAEGLACWFGSTPLGRVGCREQGGGWILPAGDGNGDRDELEGSSFLRHLAAEARGNASTACGLWAGALRRAGSDGSVRDAADSPQVTAVAWGRLLRPTLGRRARPEDIAILHTLALHGPLPLEVFYDTLPFGAPVLERSLSALAAAELVEQIPDGWGIHRAGYPAVRRELIAAGHAADAF